MSNRDGGGSAAVDRVVATIDDALLAERYPDRTHFVDAANPQHGTMVSRALLDGDPAVLVYPDGHETLFTPEQARGVGAVLLLLAVAWLHLRGRKSDGDVIQLPPRTRIEARDSSGLPVAA